MDNYHELHLPEKWKDGDILVKDTGLNNFAVRSNVSTGSWGENFFRSHLLVNPVQIIESPIGIFCNADYHKADSEELRQFHEFLHEHGKDWDADKKQLVEWRWKPKNGDTYYYITDFCEVTYYIWNDSKLDWKYRNVGNCFQTKEEVEAMADKIKKLLKGE